MKYLLLIAMWFSTSCIFAAPLTLDQVLEATCMIYNGRVAGSGTCIARSATEYYILTNAHVVERQKTVKVYFFKNGYRSNPLNANVLWSSWVINTNKDLAILGVSAKLFGKYPPRVIPLVQRDYTFTLKDKIYSAGCPEARWMMAWQGRVLQDKITSVLFTPGPIGGQSGSGILVDVNINGKHETRVAAVLTWLFSKEENNQKSFFGGAIPISVFYNLYDNKAVTSYTIPPNAIPISYYTYALGDNNVWYPVLYENGKGYVIPPKGVKIVGWSKDGQPPRRPPPVTPIENLPDDKTLPLPIYPDNVDDNEVEDENAKKIEALQNSIAMYKEQIALLTKEKEALVLEAGKSQEFIDKSRALQEQLNKVNAELNEASTKLISATETSEQYKAKFNEVTQQTDQYVSQIQQIQEDKALLTKELQKTTAETEEKISEIVTEKDAVIDSETTQKNVAFAGVTALALGGIGLGIRTWLKNRALKIAAKAATKLGTRGIVKTATDVIKAVDIPIVNKVATKITDKVTSDKVDNLINVVDALKNIVTKTDSEVDKSEVPSYNSVDAVLKELQSVKELINKPNTTVEVSNTTNVNQLDAVLAELKALKESLQTTNTAETTSVNLDTSTNPRIKQFFDMKAATDGESVEQWAIYCGLYEEAVNMLKNNLFTINGSELQGQQITAEKIDLWVSTQYLKRLTAKELNCPNVYHQAMLGFLYKSAIEVLKNGEFMVLGADTTAEVVESWVKKEFLKRIGIKK